MPEEEKPKDQPKLEIKVNDDNDISKIRNWEIVDTNSAAIIKKSKDIESSNRGNKPPNTDD